MPPAQAKPVSVEYLASLWSTQDSLLQQYRVIFVTLQSILVSFGGLIVFRDNSLGPMIAVTMIVGVTMYLWLSVCRPRSRAVFFCQGLMLRAEAGELITQPFQKLKDFQGLPVDQQIKDSSVALLTGKGAKTRNKMDTILPIMFFIGWCLLWLLVVLQLVQIDIRFITVK
jgi:hypothetical protein